MDNDSDMLEILLSYKTMALESSHHRVMIKDKTIVQFLAYSLDSEDPDIVDISLQTLDLLSQNRPNVNTLRNTFGIMEAISATSQRKDLDSDLRSLAACIHYKLENAVFSRPPSPVDDGPVTPSKKIATKIYTFHVFGLNEERRQHLVDCMVRVRGVVSVVVDVPHQRCMVRVVDGTLTSPENLTSVVSKQTPMYASLIIKNKKDQEVLQCMDEDINERESDLPAYLPEDDSPVKDKAMISIDRLRSSASSWVRSASTFLQEALYW